MDATVQKLLERAHEGGNYTLNELRDHFSPQISQQRALELTIELREKMQDWTEAERASALICALMMELI